MGTRALTRVYDEQGKLIVFIYRQSDGFPYGHGAALKGIIAPLRLVNGLSERRGVANGMECLAGQIVAGLKTQAGDIYLQAPEENPTWMDYTYDITQNELGYAPTGSSGSRHVMLKVTSFSKVLYDGPISDFDPNADFSSDTDD